LQASRADRMKKNDLKAQVATVVRACQEKKAADISILRLDEQASGFTDYFILCSGANPRQVQAIADEIDQQLSAIGVQPKHIEGYTQADWLLMDYVDFVVHIFSESARKFYDLERLWKSAKRLQPADLEKAQRKSAARKTPAKRTAKPKLAAKAKSAPKRTSVPRARKRS
jgi:ribosome-associated protein